MRIPAIAMLLFLVLLGMPVASAFDMSVSWTVPSGGSPTPPPNPIGGIAGMPHAYFLPEVRLFTSTVDFTSHASANVSFWSWDFGDGGVGYGPNISHSYSVSGLWQSYAVTLRTCSALACNTTTQSVSLLNWPFVVVAIAGTVLVASAIVVAVRSKSFRNARSLSGRIRIVPGRVTTRSVRRHFVPPRVRIVTKTVTRRRQRMGR